MNDIEKQVTPSEEQQAEANSTESDFMADVEKSMVQLRPGQTITGTVVQITDDEVCVNIGFKSDGLIKREDLVRMGEGGLCLNCPVCTWPNCGFGKGV